MVSQSFDSLPFFKNFFGVQDLISVTDAESIHPDDGYDEWYEQK